MKWVSECMSQPKILTQWNKASASDKATDKLLCHLGALSEAVFAGHKSSVSLHGEAKAWQKMPRSTLGLHWLQPLL